MAVPGGSDARSTLHDLLHGGTDATWLHQPHRPDDVTAEGGTDLPDAPPQGYLGDATYAAPDDDAVLDRSPAAALDLTAEQLAAYRAASVDLTMRGGTTSGVIYPLAVCEIARRFRVRNVGGASAGAIAAAATAAAELGRSRLAAGAEPTAPDTGHVRSGYAGLAATVAWLAELDGADVAGREQHRLASLFQPARASRAVWAVVVAVLRGRLWAAAPRAVVAFGTGWALGVLGLVLAAVAALAVLLPDGSVLGRTGVTLGVLVSVAALTAGAVGTGLRVRAAGLRRRGRSRLQHRSGPSRRLLRVTSDAPGARPRRTLVLWLALLVAGVVGLVVAGGRATLAGVPVAVSLVVAALGLLAVPALRLLGDAQGRHYGLLSGATRTAGAPRPLVTWLDETLSELAGQPGRTLTFGDLWFGDGPVDPEAVTDARRRRINLELVATDLTQQRAVRFPLLPGAELRERWGSVPHVRHDDLVELFGPALADALCPAGTAVPAQEQWPDGAWHPVTVHPLPEPPDLPVVVAVRASLALPGLFTAVRTYRLRRPTTVRDDLGAELGTYRSVFTWPPEDVVAAGPVAEAVWLADGGITSNFPVQLFDTLLPEWPTFGLNLGPHPEGFEHQDVWLPQDWQAGLPPAEPVGASALGLLAAVLDTARSWRDRAQTAMPSTRGRVAWVREHPGEGGTNLFMGRDVVASLALRGALAGARLRQRYAAEPTGDRPSWDRHRWLRLRVAVRALDETRERVSTSVAGYLPLLEPGAGEAAARAPEPTQHKPLYLPGEPGFTPGACRLLGEVGSGEAVPGARTRTPQPAPELAVTPPL